MEECPNDTGVIAGLPSGRDGCGRWIQSTSRGYTGRMPAVTFDALKFVERLTEAGVPESQAKAMAMAQIEALGEATAFALATKADVYDLKSELRLMKWMLGFLLALCVANLWLLIRLAAGGPVGG